MDLILAIALGSLIMVIRDIAKQREIKKFWKKWEENSFEWAGYRLNKDYYEVVDGQLKEKERKPNG